jgi:hypothetical protein
MCHQIVFPLGLLSEPSSPVLAAHGSRDIESSFAGRTATSTYREESKDMAATSRPGELADKRRAAS